MSNEEVKINLMASDVHNINSLVNKGKGFAKLVTGILTALSIAAILALFSMNTNLTILLERDKSKQQQLDNFKSEIQEIKIELKNIRHNQNTQQ